MSAKQYKRERDAAFEADDIAWAAKQMPGASSPRVVEIAFHKARSACASISEAKRLESAAWLAGNGYAPFGQVNWARVLL